MTQTEQITDRVCRRNGLPATLEKELPNLPFDSCLYASVPDQPIRKPEPEQVDGNFFVGVLFALTVEAFFATIGWIVLHAWRIL